MNILYIHGFGSSFDPASEKIRTLSKIGTVFGVDVDYCQGFDSVIDTVLHKIDQQRIDLIVGTSMGGYTASHISSRTGIPFVALNPVVDAAVTLERYLGEFEDYRGNHRLLDETAIRSYPKINTNATGMILLDQGDEIIDADQTRQALDGIYRLHMFENGNHRFDHLEESLDVILHFWYFV